MAARQRDHHRRFGSGSGKGARSAVALKALTLALLVVGVLQSSPANSQLLTTEADVTGGYSNDGVTAVATQLRGFGELKAGVRFYLEGAWATRWFRDVDGDGDSDAFSAAYPYDNRIQFTEAFAERMFRPGKGLVGIRAGRYRTPFGISGRSDYAYSGFLRAPLIRYDDSFALTNNFLERGADLIVGTPQLYLETSLGMPSDLGTEPRRPGLDTVVRLQGYHGNWIVGVSHIRTLPYQSPRFADGRTVFTGIDVRWSRDGVLASGEWITGQPFDGTTTDGWHADVTVHRPPMGPLTAVLRAEQLDYDAAAPLALRARRLTAGARIRLPRGLTAQVDVLHQTGGDPEYSTALDAALTYSIRIH
jgi:hypothetical protein